MTTVSLKTASVGDRLPDLTTEAVNRTTLALYAGASGDHNPIHIDIDFARNAGMPDVFAHGMLSMAYLGRLLTGWTDQRNIREFNTRFVAITNLGDKLTCSGKIVDIFEREGEKCASLEVQTANQAGEVKLIGAAVIAIS